nr:MAG TPA: hypothetical protein [Caudoviricetes sp.]
MHLFLRFETPPKINNVSIHTRKRVTCVPDAKNEKSNISTLIRCRMALLKYHSIRHMSSPQKIKKPPSGGIFYKGSLCRLVSAADLVILQRRIGVPRLILRCKPVIRHTIQQMPRHKPAVTLTENPLVDYPFPLRTG